MKKTGTDATQLNYLIRILVIYIMNVHGTKIKCLKSFGDVIK